MKNRLYKNAHRFFVLSICSICIGVVFLFIGGLSYTNPQLEFVELYNLEPLKNLLFTLLPSLK